MTVTSVVLEPVGVGGTNSMTLNFSCYCARLIYYVCKKLGSRSLIPLLFRAPMSLQYQLSNLFQGVEGVGIW